LRELGPYIGSIPNDSGVGVLNCVLPVKGSGMRVLVLSSSLVLAVTAVFAANEPMANYYGNTVILETAHSEQLAHYRADGTVDVTMFSECCGSPKVTGTWKIDNKGQLCRAYISLS